MKELNSDGGYSKGFFHFSLWESLIHPQQGFC